MTKQEILKEVGRRKRTNPIISMQSYPESMVLIAMDEYAAFIARKAYSKGYNVGSVDEMKDRDTEQENWNNFKKENDL